MDAEQREIIFKFIQESEDIFLSKFIFYSPGKNESTMMETLNNPQVIAKKIKNIILDFYDTSSEEKSDSEIDD
jgi:hypothetical protein